MSSRASAPELLDRRSVRFAALIASILLGAALALGPIDGLALVAVQMFAFATGAVMGPGSQPFVSLYRRTLGRGGKPATRLAPAPAVQFGQTIGLVATFVALMGGVLNAAPVFLVATAAALAGALVELAVGSSPLGSLLARATGRPSRTVRIAPAASDDDATAGASLDLTDQSSAEYELQVR